MPVPSARYLTKSRFKLAQECPTKLFYTGKPEYANTTLEDEFLAALADGGFQVGELAKLMYPDGIEVTAVGNAEAIARTQELLNRHTVTLYEAAIASGPLLVRVDVLRKVGDEVDVIEVKAKSFDSTDPLIFKGVRGGWVSGMRPYLEDVAFQTFVLKRVYPDWRIKAFLMMTDKAKTCTVDGLNQRFRIQRVEGSRQHVIVAPGTTPATIGEPILTATSVDVFVDEMLSEAQDGFAKRALRLADAYAADHKIPPNISSACASCEFRGDERSALRSGFHECWGGAKGWDRASVDAGTVLDIANFRDKDKLIRKGVFAIRDVSAGDLKLKEGEDGLSTSQRQWMQVSGQWPGGGHFFIDRDYMRREMAVWTFPLHFIDFETARVAIPFFAGQRPYANIAFQFSHHRVELDGTVTHAHDFLSTVRGVSPNYDFVRALRAAVGPEGTIFMWTAHENTTLRAILAELDDDSNAPADAEELREFLLSSTRDGAREGARAMYDLCVMARKAFFHPATRGSSSIKKVLPSVMAASDFLRERYGQPIYGAPGGIPSLNFVAQQWWQENAGAPINPYDLLPKVFDDLPPEAVARLEADDDMEIAQGGAATTAWARFQFEESATMERDKVAGALRRYCELDTLAMVMIYEAWREWVR
jgi:hypothetical protein